MASVGHPRRSFGFGPAGVAAPVVEERLGERTGVLSWHGSLGTEGADALHLAIDRAVEVGCCDLVIDLTEAHDVTPYLAVVLLNAQRLTVPEDGFVCIAADAVTKRLLQFTALSTVWPVEPTRAAALSHLLSRPA
jgi:hypothetical protein